MGVNKSKLVQVSPLGSLGWITGMSYANQFPRTRTLWYYIYIFMLYMYITNYYFLIYINYYINHFFRVSLWSSLVVLAFSTASLTIPAFSSRPRGRETEDLWRKGQRVWGAPEGAIQRHRWTNIRLPETSRIFGNLRRCRLFGRLTVDQWALLVDDCGDTMGGYYPL